MVDDGRERRLAEALRANLRRRKAQARAIGEGTTGDDRPPAARDDVGDPSPD